MAFEQPSPRLGERLLCAKAASKPGFMLCLPRSFAANNGPNRPPTIGHCSIADVDATPMRQVFDIAQRQRAQNVEPHRYTNHLAAGPDVAKKRRFAHIQGWKSQKCAASQVALTTSCGRRAKAPRYPERERALCCWYFASLRMVGGRREPERKDKA